MKSISVFKFESFSQFLAGYLKLAQKQNPSYSAAQFARKLEIAPSTLNGLIREKTDPSLSLVIQAAGKLGLSDTETDYLSLLVQLEKAKDPSERAYFQKRLLFFRKKGSELTVELDRFSLVSDWYYSALLELGVLKKFKFTAKNAANLLGVDEKLAFDALNRMTNLGWFKLREDGTYERFKARPVVNSGTKSSPAMRHYYREYLKKIDAAILNQDPDRRFSGSETFALSKDQLETLRDLVFKFLDEVADLPSQVSDHSKVYHVAVHAFELASSRSN